MKSIHSIPRGFTQKMLKQSKDVVVFGVPIDQLTPDELKACLIEQTRTVENLQVAVKLSNFAPVVDEHVVGKRDFSEHDMTIPI